MILSDFARAVGQITDPAFRRVILWGVLLALGLLCAIYVLFLGGVQVLVGDTVTLPLVGEVRGVDTLLSWGSLILMMGLSVFLMVPVASAFTGFFLEDVAQAVEARHYPTLPPAPGTSFGQAAIDTVNFLAVLLVANLAALLIYPFAGLAAPLVFWALNGFLLGREYFQLVASRRLGAAQARALRARHAGQIWLAGTLMAAPLSIPFLNLLIPVLGAATFTHLFQRLSAGASGQTHPDRAR